MTTAPTTATRFLSGVQPSGQLHLGNYFGAIKQHVELQAAGECFYFIADYHALTTIQNRDVLATNTFDVAATYLACGLDPERATFYRQSDVPAVTELAWLLATVTGMGLLERATSYKDKVARGIGASVGLFTYPVLMAADILGPQADVVPVGADQVQHVEMTRDMARAFNAAYGVDIFRIPDYRLDDVARVPGIRYQKRAYVKLRLQVEKRPQTTDPAFPPVLYLLPDFPRSMQAVLRRFADSDPGLRNEDELAEFVRPKIESELELVMAQSIVEVFTERTLADAGQDPHAKHLVIGADSVLFVENVLRDEGSTAEIVYGFELTRPVVALDYGGFTVTEHYLNGYPNPVPEVVDDGRMGDPDSHVKCRAHEKMSKSYGNVIGIFDEGKTLKKRVMSIETDSAGVDDPKPDQVKDDLVLQFYRLVAEPDEIAELEDAYCRGGTGYGEAKKRLLAKLGAYFAPFRAKYRHFCEHPAEVEAVLQAGATRAREVIGETLALARDACGLGSRGNG